MDVHDLTAAYALDALDAEECLTYEAHLAQCEACRTELSTLGETATALAWAVEAPAPPDRLRSSILAAAAAERENVVPLRRPWLFRATAGAAAVAACAAIGLGVWAGTLSHSLGNERSAERAAARAMQIFVDPTSRKVSLRGGDGTVAVDRGGNAALIVRRLPAAPAGKTYEAWVIPKGGAPKRAGIFPGGEPLTMMPLDETVPPGAVVAATVERSGGVDAPTQTPFLTAQT